MTVTVFGRKGHCIVAEVFPTRDGLTVRLDKTDEPEWWAEVRVTTERDEEALCRMADDGCPHANEE